MKAYTSIFAIHNVRQENVSCRSRLNTKSSTIPDTTVASTLSRIHVFVRVYVLSADRLKIPEHFKGVMIQEVLHLAAVAFPNLTVILLYMHILTNKYERLAATTLMFLILATW